MLYKSLAAAILCGSIAIGMPAHARAPNILFIYTDDQSTETFDYMPFLQKKKNEARVFRHFLHAMGVCCPSRTSMFTGMYPHNSHVEKNLPPDGGYQRFLAEGLPQKSWPILLQGAGYRPSLSGKLLNGYDYPAVEIMPGFVDWFVAYDFKPFNYPVSDNGTISYFGNGNANYKTNVLADRVDRMIRRAHRRDKPFAILFSTSCPHYPSTPSAKYRGTAAKRAFIVSRKPNFNEADVSDKPPVIQQLPRLTREQIDSIKASWRKRIECGYSIDEAFQRFWRTLERLGELNNTYIFLTTDNGWMQGEHRIPSRKNVPYVESFESRLFVWGPQVVAGEDRKLVGNIDLMPTMLEIAGLDPANYDWIDGRSFLPLLKGVKNPALWRRTFMVQGRPQDGDTEDDGAVPEPQKAKNAIKQSSRTAFWSLIAQHNDRNYIYTQYHGEQDGVFEFYDLAADPYQLDNAYDSLDARERAAMQERLDALKICAGQTCRGIDVLRAPR